MHHIHEKFRGRKFLWQNNQKMYFLKTFVFKMLCSAEVHNFICILLYFHKCAKTFTFFMKPQTPQNFSLGMMLICQHYFGNNRMLKESRIMLE